MTFVLMGMWLESEIIYVPRYLEFLNMLNTENLQEYRKSEMIVLSCFVFCWQGSINKLILLNVS